jgi:tRNA nucleotidyltransferase (CCA-adding enzyme)
MNVGKSDSPREHLPVHYRHIERGRPRIDAICARFNAPADCHDLALLAIAECERVHRTSDVRAGPIALMLERVGAFAAPELFKQLMNVCACDFCASGDRSGQDYPKAALLDAALKACAEIDEDELTAELGAAEALDALQSARAGAIAQAFNSQRWSNEVS